MSRRLGERLVGKGLLQEEQLGEALQTQLLSGGTLGTTLLDLGFVEEADLGTTLAEILRAKYADQDRLNGIPPEVLELLSARLAEKHLALPLKLAGKTLHVAAVHPKHLGALSRSTGYKIVPWVAPEVRIHEALEKHYGITRRPRYLRLARELERRATDGSHATVTAGAERETLPDLGDTSIDRPAELYGYGRDWRSVAAELDDEIAEQPDDDDAADAGDETGDVDRSERRNEISPAPGAPCRRLADVLERMCEADHKEELFEAVLDYASQKLDTCILFGVRSQLAHVWDWRGSKLAGKRTRKLKFPVTGGSIFSLLLGNSRYHGPPGEDAGCRRFFELLNVDPPEEVLLLPVYVNDRLLAVFYGGGAQGDADEEDVANYLSLIDKLSLGFNLLILKMKIRA